MMNSLVQAILHFAEEYGLELALSVVAFAASTLVGYLRDRKLAIESAGLQKEIDRDRELLSQQGGIINLILSQQQKGQSYTIERQAQAAEKVWVEVLRLRELVAPCVSIDSVLLPSERHGEKLCKTGGLERDDAMRRVKEYLNNDHLEELRPYLGEGLWIQFFTLRAFSCRCLFYYDRCVSEDKDVIWSEDDGIRQMLGWVIKDEKKMNSLYAQNDGMRFLQSAQELLEGMVYESISRILTGEVASEDSVKVLASLKKMVPEIQHFQDAGE